MSTYPFNPNPAPMPPFEAALFYITWFGGIIFFVYFLLWWFPLLIKKERGGQENV